MTGGARHDLQASSLAGRGTPDCRSPIRRPSTAPPQQANSIIDAITPRAMLCQFRAGTAAARPVRLKRDLEPAAPREQHQLQKPRAVQPPERQQVEEVDAGHQRQRQLAHCRVRVSASRCRSRTRRYSGQRAEGRAISSFQAATSPRLPETAAPKKGMKIPGRRGSRRTASPRSVRPRGTAAPDTRISSPRPESDFCTTRKSASVPMSRRPCSGARPRSYSRASPRTAREPVAGRARTSSASGRDEVSVSLCRVAGARAARV